MDLQTIINEADLRIPNPFSQENKVDWLNEVNQEFFEVVKIPAVSTFSTLADVADYAVDANVRARNVAKVQVGNTTYKSFLYERTKPGEQFWTLDEATGQMTLNPAPLQAKTGNVLYFKIPTTTFVSTNLAAEPDAPKEYQWLYVLGLCERIAKAMNDTDLANNYAADYRGNLGIAQQNYQTAE